MFLILYELLLNKSSLFISQGNDIWYLLIFQDLAERFDNTEGVIKSLKSKEDWQLMTDQTKKDKQLSTNHYTEDYKSSNTNPTKKRGLNPGAPEG